MGKSDARAVTMGSARLRIDLLPTAGRTSSFARVVLLATTGVLLVFALWELSVLVPHVLSQRFALGVDFHQYQVAARHFLGGDGFYPARQLGGPYAVLGGDVLYPPTILYLIVPFLVLPEVAWWAIPLGTLAYVVLRLRPAMWTWPLLAFAAAWPRDQALVLFGNPTMWVAAAVGGAVIWGWTGPLVLLKPTLAPLALVGIWRRSWWLCLLAVVGLTVPMLPLAIEYVRVVSDARTDTGLLYSLADLPIVLVPLVAWLGSRTLRASRQRAELGTRLRIRRTIARRAVAPA